MSHTDHFWYQKQKLLFSLSFYSRFGPRATCCKLSKYPVTPRPHKMAAAYGPQPSLKILGKGPRKQWDIILLLLLTCPRNIIWYIYIYICYIRGNWDHIRGNWDQYAIPINPHYSPSTWLQQLLQLPPVAAAAASSGSSRQRPASWDNRMDQSRR